jgi:hypothetical protein
MTDDSYALPEDLRYALSHDFFIRFTAIGRKSGKPRTTETTFVWEAMPSGPQRIYVSGYPGKRDWVANVRVNKYVMLHTVEHGVHYDIPATARVITERRERTVPLLAFLDRWASRPGAEQRIFGLLISAIRLNRRLRLPWWGPFYIARRILDRMPCVELTFAGNPARRVELSQVAPRKR